MFLVVAYVVFGMSGSRTDRNLERVLLVTSMGNITVELLGDMPDFVIQGGDANAKGIIVPTIRDELPNKHSNVRGCVEMAKTNEPNSATSQFYVNLKDNVRLDSNYSVFGAVVDGMSVVDAIGSVAADASDKPLQDVTLIRAELIK